MLPVQRFNLKRKDSRPLRSPLPDVRLLLSAIALLTTLAGPLAPAPAEDRIILRNLKLVRGRTVESIDIDGVVLNDGTSLTWDRIEKAKIESVDQKEFDKFLNQLSDPLFRIRLRLINNDDIQALAIADRMFPIYQSSKGELATLVCAGLVRGRVASGQREQSVVPLLHYLSRVEAGGAQKLTKSLQLSIDSETHICGKLMPVWFDDEQAKEQLPFLIASLGSVKNASPEFHIYTGSLAIAAGDFENAKKAIDALDNSKPIQASLKTLLQAQLSIKSNRSAEVKSLLAKLIESDSPQIRALALYWTGLAGVAGKTKVERMRGALTLLQIPASIGDQFPELAAAALFQASNVVDSESDSSQRDSLRRELLQKYPDSWHAQLVRRTGSQNK